MRIVCYCAHPDDMVLGAGGYIARLTEEEENEFTAAFANDGLLHAPKYMDTRGWAEEACRILGVKDVRWLNVANQRFDTFALIDINKRYEALGLEPDLLLTNSRGQLNKDHRLVYESARVVTRPSEARQIDLLCFESTVWRIDGFHPNLYVDISETLDRKIEAMEAFKSEVRLWPHPRSIKAIGARAEYWGLQAGFEAAEPFEVLQWYR